MDLTHPKKPFQSREATQFPHACFLISLLPQVAEIRSSSRSLFQENMNWENEMKPSVKYTDQSNRPEDTMFSRQERTKYLILY